MDKIAKLQQIIDKSEYIVFFGGAGVSVESGIPDFRGEDGIYKQNNTIPPEVILSRDFFYSDTFLFYKFYKEKMIFKSAKPNQAHLFLSKLEQSGKLKAIITQNIDNLHQLAGSANVYELHGSRQRNYCTKCHKFFDFDYIINSNGIPLCDVCGNIVKPDVTLYQEELNYDTLMTAINHIAKADCLIVGGTSLTVYPAAGLIQYFKGENIIIVNKSTTDYDSYATLVINEAIGDTFSKLKVR